MKWVGKWPFCRDIGFPFCRGTFKGDPPTKTLVNNPLNFDLISYGGCWHWGGLKPTKKTPTPKKNWLVLNPHLVAHPFARHLGSGMADHPGCSWLLITKLSTAQKTKKTTPNPSSKYAFMVGNDSIDLSEGLIDSLKVEVLCFFPREWMDGYTLDLPPTQDASGKWRFRLGFPSLKMVHNPGGDWNPGWGVDLRYTHFRPVGVYSLELTNCPWK